MTSDTRLRAAEALRDEALAHDAVALLVEEAPYETQGSDGAVYGIAVREEGGLLTARMGLALDLAHVLNRSVEDVVQDVRACMIRRWKTLEPDREIAIDLDVVTLLSM
jgi:hypothetical protein